MSIVAGRRIAITGANSGIGLVAALRLAAAGAEIVLVCRDPDRGEEARRDVAAVARGPEPSLLLADLASQASVRSLAAEMGRRFDRLDTLVNNAGAVFAHRRESPDGIELTLATNHLAPFLLTDLLLGQIEAAPAGRIVTVSSQVHAASLDMDDLQGRPYSPMRAYAASKLANILFTYELARRIAGGRTTANCLAPGLVATNFGRRAGGMLALATRILGLMPFALSPEEGARTTIHLCAAPELADVSGRYYYRCAETRSKPASYDEALAARLWERSEELTRVRA